MKRSISQENGKRAEDIFGYNRPNHWIFRKQGEEDYGIDYEIELLETEDVEGIIFKGQLKGTEKLRFIDNNTKIGFSLSSDSLKYYLYEIKIPTILFVCDIINENIYWIRLTGNKEIMKVYDEFILKEKQESATIYIPTDNKFEKTEYDKILFEVLKAEKYIHLENARKIPQPLYYDMIKSKEINRESEKASLERRLELLTFTEYEEEIIKLEPIDKLAKIDEFILKNPSIELHLHFLKMKEAIIIPTQSRHERFLFLKENSNKIKKITKNAEFDYKVFGLLHKIYFDIDCEQMKMISLEMNKDKMNILVYEISREIINIRIVHKFNWSIKILNKMFEKNRLSYFPELLTKLIMTISKNFHGMEDIVREFYINILTKLNDYAEKIICDFRVDNQLFYVLMNKVTLATYYEDKIFDDTIKEIYNRISSFKIEEKEKYNVAINMQIDRRKKIFNRDNFQKMKFEDVLLGYYNFQAISNNLDKESDLYFYYDIGIKDINPERILKKCKHLEISYNHRNFIVDNFNMPSAGRKEIKCTVVERSILSVQIDDGYESFSQMFCSKCKEKKERIEFSLNLELFYKKGCKYPYLTD